MTAGAPGGPDHSMHEERPDPRSLPDEPAMRVPSVLVLSLLLARPVVAEDPTPEEKLEALEQKVKILERKEELAREAADAAAPDAVSVTAGKDGFTLRGGGG